MLISSEDKVGRKMSSSKLSEAGSWLGLVCVSKLDSARQTSFTSEAMIEIKTTNITDLNLVELVIVIIIKLYNMCDFSSHMILIKHTTRILF